MTTKQTPQEIVDSLARKAADATLTNTEEADAAQWRLAFARLIAKTCADACSHRGTKTCQQAVDALFGR